MLFFTNCEKAEGASLLQTYCTYNSANGCEVTIVQYNALRAFSMSRFLARQLALKSFDTFVEIEGSLKENTKNLITEFEERSINSIR